MRYFNRRIKFEMSYDAIRQHTSPNSEQNMAPLNCINSDTIEESSYHC